MMLKIVHSAINTKALSRWSELACSIALDAVRTVEVDDNGRKEIDIKKYAKVEKVRQSLGAAVIVTSIGHLTADVFRFQVGSLRTRAS